MIKRTGRLLSLCAVFALIFPAFLTAQADRDVAISSLVRIRCTFDDGSEMVSTGFAWNDGMHVVTALHGVAGCKTRLIKKEGGKQTTAEIKSVSRVADLAYLSLDNDIGLAPVQMAPKMPSTRGEFYTWGYPQGVFQSTDASTKFAGGQKGGLTTLKGAFNGIEQLDGLFQGQDYPRQDTSILRVTSTLQPGQSGAPILDSDGYVVAIADGGLLDGFRGINWSIPAHVYLEDLPFSLDKVPQQRSVWAALYSKVTPAAPEGSAVQSPGAGTVFGSGDDLLHVRTLTLGVLEDILIQKGQEDSNIDFIRQILEQPGQFDQLAFDVYEDTVTGATLGIPTGIDGVWDTSIGTLSAETPSQVISMQVGVLTFESFEEAVAYGKGAFVDSIYHFAEWNSPPEDLYLDFNDELEWASGANFIKGIDNLTGAPSELNLSITISGNQVLGYAVFGPEMIEDLPQEDLVAYLMMQMSVQKLSGFAQY